MTDRAAGGANSQQLHDLLPASVQLPPWLPPVLATLLDGCASGPDDGWVRSIAGRLLDSGGAVPFAVVHDWQAHTVLAMMLTVFEDVAASQAIAALRRLHDRALAGEPAPASVWRAALEPALHELYRLSYDSAGSYAAAHASATAYATANNFSPDGAVSFAESYAAHSADANRQSFAESTAPAVAAALAAAYGRRDGSTATEVAEGDLVQGKAAEVAYAEAYPFALVRACAHAMAQQQGEPDGLGRRRQAAYLRLADGLADSLARLG